MFRVSAIAIALLWAIVGHAESITISAAVSLKEPLQAIARDFESGTGHKVTFNFGASGQLMAQIQQGAPVDAFISASPVQTAQLRKDGLTTQTPERIIARNRLVLITSAGKSAVTAFADLADARVARIAVGQPKTVPAGDYAMQVLEKLDIASAAKDRLIFGANVRQVLDYVVRGEVDAGVVYATDAREAGDKVKVVATADPTWHKPIVYPAVILRGRPNEKVAASFTNYLLATQAQSTLARCGFEVEQR